MRLPACLTLAVVAAALAAPAAAQELSAAQIVARNAEARGGAAAWRKIEALSFTGRVESASRAGRKTTFRLDQQRPGRSRFDVTSEGQRALRVFDGSRGWKVRTGADGRPEVQPYAAEEVRFAAGAPLIEGPLMDHVARGARVALAGLQALEGRRVYALELRLPAGDTSRVWVDAETFLERRYDREAVDQHGRPLVASVLFSDYREVGGLRLPFTIETGAPAGQAPDRLLLEHVELNPRLDDRTYARPGVPVARHGLSVDTRGVAKGAPARPAP